MNKAERLELELPRTRRGCRLTVKVVGAECGAVSLNSELSAVMLWRRVDRVHESSGITSGANHTESGCSYVSPLIFCNLNQI
jgi:hypothetical protein